MFFDFRSIYFLLNKIKFSYAENNVFLNQKISFGVLIESFFEI